MRLDIWNRGRSLGRSSLSAWCDNNSNCRIQSSDAYTYFTCYTSYFISPRPFSQLPSLPLHILIRNCAILRIAGIDGRRMCVRGSRPGGSDLWGSMFYYLSNGRYEAHGMHIRWHRARILVRGTFRGSELIFQPAGETLTRITVFRPCSLLFTVSGFCFCTSEMNVFHYESKMCEHTLWFVLLTYVLRSILISFHFNAMNISFVLFSRLRPAGPVSYFY